MSDVAHGIMGFNLSGGAGGRFPWDFVDQTNGTCLVQHDADALDEYNDMELYLMGMLAPEEVSPGRVFPNQD